MSLSQNTQNGSINCMIFFRCTYNLPTVPLPIFWEYEVWVGLPEFNLSTLEKNTVEVFAVKVWTTYLKFWPLKLSNVCHCATVARTSGGDQIEIRSDEIRVEVQQQQKYKFFGRALSSAI